MQKHKCWVGVIAEVREFRLGSAGIGRIRRKDSIWLGLYEPDFALTKWSSPGSQ